MRHRFAFAGFGHAHIYELCERGGDSAQIELAGACEPEERLRAVAEVNGIELTHDSYEQMLDSVDCNVVAIGSYFGARGAIAIAALHRGKHVIADKPLCTSLEELEQIESLAAANALRVGCMLDMRSNRAFAGVRHLIRQGALGDIHAIALGGHRLGGRLGDQEGPPGVHRHDEVVVLGRELSEGKAECGRSRGKVDRCYLWFKEIV